MPSEDKMSVANRRQVQEALHRLGYYDGPVDGIFGPLTRAATRRFQDSIGEKSTGHLTAAEASSLSDWGFDLRGRGQFCVKLWGKSRHQS